MAERKLQKTSKNRRKTRPSHAVPPPVKPPSKKTVSFVIETLKKQKREQAKQPGKQQRTMLDAFQSQRKDAFFMLISTVLSVRNRDESTEVVARELLSRYPTPQALASAPLQDIEAIIKPTGFFRQKAKNIQAIANIIITTFGGAVPQTMHDLTSLPGVGRKVAGCVLVYAFGKNTCIPVDTHVHRISNRLGWVATKNPNQTEQELMKCVPRKYWKNLNDLFVIHGKTICKPITPSCKECPVRSACKRVGVPTRHEQRKKRSKSRHENQ